MITAETEGHVECTALWDIVSHTVCCDVYFTLMQTQKVKVFMHRTSAAEFYTNPILNTANEIDIICRIYTAHNHEMLVSLLASVLAEKPKRVPLWTDVQHTAEFTVFQPVNLSFTSGLLADGRNCFKLKLNHSIDSSQTSHHCSHSPFRNTE